MLSFKQFVIVPLDERKMSPYHRQALARAHRGNRQSSVVKAKISRSMKGNTNREGTKQDTAARNRISIKRGDYDPIRGKSWIKSRYTGKTERKYHAPAGFKIHER